jgi:hypothetical protein
LHAQQSGLFDGGLPDFFVDPTPPDSSPATAAIWSDTASSIEADDTATPARPVENSPIPRDSGVTESGVDTTKTAAASTSVEANRSMNQEMVEDKPEDTERPAEVARTGWLAVMTNPSAEIFIDGIYRGDSPGSRIQLTSGTHALECKTPGYESYYEVIKITTGELSTRNIVLTRLLGYVSISTIEGAEVYVDGTLIGVTPLAQPIELEAGRHQITVKKAGYNVWNNAVNLEAKQILPLKITLTPMY